MILGNYEAFTKNEDFIVEVRDIAIKNKNYGVLSFISFEENRKNLLTQVKISYDQKALLSAAGGTTSGSGNTGSSSSGTTSGSGNTGSSSSGTTSGSGSTGSSSSGTTSGSGNTGSSSSGTTSGSGSTGSSSSGTTSGSGNTGSSSSGTTSGSGSTGSSSSGSSSGDNKFTVSGIVIRPGETDIEGEDLTNPADDPDAYKPGEMGDNDTLIRLGGIIVGALKIIGIIAAVVTLVILGIKYLTGTIQEKAEYKKTMMPYIVGAFLLGAGGVLIEIIYNLITGLTFS